MGITHPLLESFPLSKLEKCQTATKAIVSFVVNMILLNAMECVLEQNYRVAVGSHRMNFIK